jgi:putative oxidoreductase
MIPERYAPAVYALFRAVFGLLFLFHGLQKTFGLFGGIDMHGGMPPTASELGAAGLIELIGGALILVGFLTRYAVFLGSGEMAVAYFTAHQPHGTWPIQNGGELAVLYCFALLYIAARGSGAFSIDAALRASASP